MTEPMQPAGDEPTTPPVEEHDELDRLRRDIERQIRSNQRFLESLFDENCAEEEE